MIRPQVGFWLLTIYWPIDANSNRCIAVDCTFGWQDQTVFLPLECGVFMQIGATLVSFAHILGFGFLGKPQLSGQ
jgi:hypothetical protein